MICPMPPWLTRRASGPTNRSAELATKPLFDLPVPRSLSAPACRYTTADRCNAQAGGAGQAGDLPISDPIIV